MTKEASYKTILSLDGGGIRGVITASILHELERRTGQYRHPLGAVEGLAIDTAWPDSASYRPSCSKAGRRPRRRARSRGATREGVA